MTASAIEKVPALYRSTLQNIYGNKFGELFSGRSIQGDRYIQGRYIQVDCIFFASNYRLLIRGHALPIQYGTRSF